MGGGDDTDARMLLVATYTKVVYPLHGTVMHFADTARVQKITYQAPSRDVGRFDMVKGDELVTTFNARHRCNGTVWTSKHFRLEDQPPSFGTRVALRFNHGHMLHDAALAFADDGTLSSLTYRGRETLALPRNLTFESHAT